MKVWLEDARPAFCAQEVIYPNLFRIRLLPLLPAEAVLVLLGTNDAIGLGGEVEPEEYGRRLAALTEQLLEHGARQVVLMAPPFNNYRIKASVRLQGYGEQVAAICGSRDRVVCGPDLFRELAANDFAGSDLHPNGRGHAKIAAAVEATLREIMPLPPPAVPATAPGS